MCLYFMGTSAVLKVLKIRRVQSAELSKHHEWPQLRKCTSKLIRCFYLLYTQQTYSIALYYLLMHSPLTIQKNDILLST